MDSLFDTPQMIPTLAFHALEEGPKFIILGAVHGNETCGTQAIIRLANDLDRGEIRLLRGVLTLVPVANPLAYQRGTRIGERNLNRNFRVNPQPMDFEDRVTNRLAPLLAAHDVLLDLHSFHTPGEPFIMLGPRDNRGSLERFQRAAEEEALARRLGPKRMVEGWLDTYARGVVRRLRNTSATLRAQMLSTDPGYGVGTTEFIRSCGGYGVTLECGQHDDPQAPEVAFLAICNALAHLGMINAPPPPPQRDLEVLRLVEVVDRNHVDDYFVTPWKSFTPVEKGQVIGYRATGEAVAVPCDGYLVFPNLQAMPGNEWFYRAERSQRRIRGLSRKKSAGR